MGVKFSIIVVMLNPGDKLQTTINSIYQQTFKDYEVIIKDAGSDDGSLSCLKNFEGLNYRLEIKDDKGIYDGMNEAVDLAQGEYIFFLNCGDCFRDKNVLSNVSDKIDKHISKGYENEAVNSKRNIFYGNIFDTITGGEVASNPSIDGFGCYRNVPCHQACFYETSLVKEHKFNIKYKVRADYEQFLWCYFIAEVRPVFMDIIIADYEGGGFSETKEHLKISKMEHEEITSMYMKPSDIFKYKMILMLTLSGLRTYISHNPKLAGAYNYLKKKLYKSGGNNT